MTIIHVGELGKVFAEVQPWAPSLSEELFFAQCSLLAEKFETLLPIRTELCGEKLSTYGVHSTTIALQVGIDDEIHRIHKQAVGMLRAFFEAIGIEYIDAFIKGSINFRHAVVLSPHISLLKGAGSSILSERNIFTTVRIRCDSTAIVSHIK
ncbi:MAG TPA: hypothetical protein VNI82_00675 [Candidatus Nitrosotenuis sp.]|nr:hypothetical protein [Candidatus Nitrosotenuis sp.]